MKNKYAGLTVIPLTEIKNINNEPVDKFYADVALCNFYLTKTINITEAAKFLFNAQEIFKENGSPEQYKQVIEDLTESIKIK